MRGCSLCAGGGAAVFSIGGVFAAVSSAVCDGTGSVIAGRSGSAAGSADSSAVMSSLISVADGTSAGVSAKGGLSFAVDGV